MAEHAAYFADEKARRIYMTKNIIKKVLIYLFLTIFALFLLAPFVLMIAGSFVEPESFKQFSLSAKFEYLAFTPQNWGFTNYKEVFKTTYIDPLTQKEIVKAGNNFPVFFLNTFIVAIGSTTVTVVTAVLAAFAFARLEFKGKEVLFAVLLGTMMIPGEMMVITNYMTVRQINWMNTFAALILVHGVSVFYVFYLRQTFQQIPNELYLAAKVDGTSDLKYLWKVMIPLALPTLISITILKMMGSWNAYIWPRLVANDGYHSLITNGLRNSFTDTSGDVNYPVQMAAVALVSLPLFLVFIFLRKYIMKGVSRSGIKG